jgi:predicted ABC-type ATPase
MKRIIVIAGPNGAGKTSFARQFLPVEAACTNFINADLIAAGLSPFEPGAAAIRAGRLMLAEMDRYVKSGQSIAFETTLSGRRYAEHIPRWQRTGYQVELIWRNFENLYCPLVDHGLLYDNSGDVPKLLAEGGES